MTSDETSEHHDGSGAPPPEQDVLAAGSTRRRPWGRTAIVLTVVAGLGLAAGGVAIASGDSGTPKPSASPAPDGDGPPPHGPFIGEFGPGDALFGPGLGLVGPAIHGEMTVPREGGGYQTVHIQRGKVTSVDHSSITVKSDDGFTDTYTVDDKSLIDAGRDGIDSVKTGHTVSLTAWSVGGTDTVRQLVDATLVERYIEKYGPTKRPFLGELRQFKMRWRAHARDWMRNNDSTSGNTGSSSVVG